MAITKFISQLHPPRSGWRYVGLKKLLDYILNPDKTEGNRYVGSLNCGMTRDEALQAMIDTKEAFGKTSSNPHHRLAYHWTLSWSPDEKISEQAALQITQEFCEKYFGEDYEVVYSVHNDQDHMHSHICFNSVSRIDGKMFHYSNGNWAQHIQPLVDEICEKHDYHTLEIDTGMTLQEYFKEHVQKKNRGKAKVNVATTKNNRTYHKDSTKDYSLKDYVKKDIDDIIPTVNSYEEFLDKLKEYGYSIREGNYKYLSLQPKGAARIRSHQIGDDYTIQAIKERIADKKDKLELQSEQLSGQTDREYLFIYRLNYFKGVATPKTSYQKWYYYQMFLKGTCSKGEHLYYHQVNASLREIKKLQIDMELIDKYQLSNVTDIGKQEAVLSNRIKEIDFRRQDLYQDSYKFQKEIEALTMERRQIRKEIFYLNRIREKYLGISEDDLKTVDINVEKVQHLLKRGNEKSEKVSRSYISRKK